MAVAKNSIKNNKNKSKKLKSKFSELKNDFGTFMKFHNTITLSILTGVLLFVFLIQGIFYANISNASRGLQNSITAGIISGIRVFDEDIKNNNWNDLKTHLNEIFQGSNEIRDVIVMNNNREEVFSSIAGGEFSFINKDNPSSLKVIHVQDYDVKKYKLIYIPVQDYHVYLLILKTSSDVFYDLNRFSLGFFIFVLILGIAFSLILAKSIVKPLSSMENIISKIAEGDLSGRLDYTYYYEINKLIQSYNTMADALQRLYSTLEAQVKDRTKELKNAYSELKNTQAMMLHSEKMKSLGELVAGIMHEINNPINFIYGNMIHLNNYSKDLINIIDEYAKFDGSLEPEEKADIDKMKQNIDYEFLKSDLPDLIKSCKEGADRAKNIIQDLKSFSRMEEVAVTYVDLNHEIDMTLNILHNKLKNKAEIHKEFPDDLPKIEAYGGQLNQVFMNILDNAAGAIPDRGDIWIRINETADKEHINIEIEDNGVGMDEETSMKIFNPFFTTKPVGKGTGLGLSITYRIIKNHQGNIKVESRPNMGTKFIITLPVKQDKEIAPETIVSTGENNG